MIAIQRSYAVEKNDFTKAGEVSSNIKKIMKQVGVEPEVIRRVSVAAYETEMNIIIHSYGGTIDFQITPEHIMLEAKDRGPGIENVDLAMKKGYSTAPKNVRELGFGAGMGLPNIKRCADEFNIESVFKSHTKITLIFKLSRS